MSKYNYRTDIPTELRMFIFYNHGSYAVKNDRNMVMLTFGRFRTLDVACAAAWLLIKYDWNIRKVEEDSIYKFNNKFYVFKVINNQLIFDSIFDSFERAVEHFEINLKIDMRNLNMKKKQKPIQIIFFKGIINLLLKNQK